MSQLLDVRGLHVQFVRQDGLVRAVDGVSYTLNEGECLGLVGESGSGKTVSVLSLLRLLPHTARLSGQALFLGRDLLRMGPADIRRVRGRQIGMIFQDPITSLNPTLPVGRQIMEALLWHRLSTAREAKRRAIELLDKVGIPAPASRFNEYPHQFSGGMCQRVMIAIALACQPKLVIADEPTTALDVTVQAQILALLRQMRREYRMAMILITHDLGVAATLCDRIAVMYAGKIVEIGPLTSILRDELHPYTHGLMNATPIVGRRGAPLEPIPGSPPSLINPPPGCPFHPRCPLAIDICRRQMPPLEVYRPEQWAACWRAGEIKQERIA